MRFLSYRILPSLCLIAAVALIGPAHAQSVNSGEDLSPPPQIEYLKSKRYDETVSALSDDAMPLDIRRQALKEAALSYGARGGLAWRTFYIRSELDQFNAQLDKIFDFRQLLIAAPSGVLIEPPIVSEAQDAILIENDGQKAAVSDAIYNINRNARFTSTARSWRQYLERDWGEVKDPPAILLPRNDEEIAIWQELIDKGWAEGIAQADEIFQEDLNRLTADFEGMVRYRKLLAYGMITPPYANQTDRGVTGGGEEMRVGDRALEITGKPSLQPGASQWQPVSR
jgi:defect-in-organelle-trafficking protein DotC